MGCGERGTMIVVEGGRCFSLERGGTRVYMVLVRAVAGPCVHVVELQRW